MAMPKAVYWVREHPDGRAWQVMRNDEVIALYSVLVAAHARVASEISNQLSEVEGMNDGADCDGFGDYCGGDSRGIRGA